jgi:hypothetical protein
MSIFFEVPEERLLCALLSEALGGRGDPVAPGRRLPSTTPLRGNCLAAARYRDD